MNNWLTDMVFGFLTAILVVVGLCIAYVIWSMIGVAIAMLIAALLFGVVFILRQPRRR